MIYKAERNQKKTIFWAGILTTLGIVVLFGLASHDSFYYLISLILIIGAFWTFVSRGKPYFEINNEIINVGRLQVSKLSIVEIDFFASGEGPLYSTIVLKLDQPLDNLLNRPLNAWERYFNKSLALGPKQLSIDFGNSSELKKHLPSIQGWIDGKY